MVKKITRKKALSLALAGLMLAPSLPIQSFAETLNQGATVESKANQNVVCTWNKYTTVKKTGKLRKIGTNKAVHIFSNAPDHFVEGYSINNNLEFVRGKDMKGRVIFVDNDQDVYRFESTKPLKTGQYILTDFQKSGGDVKPDGVIESDYYATLYAAEDPSGYKPDTLVGTVTGKPGDFPDNGEKDGFYYVLTKTEEAKPTMYVWGKYSVKVNENAEPGGKYEYKDNSGDFRSVEIVSQSIEDWANMDNYLKTGKLEKTGPSPKKGDLVKYKGEWGVISDIYEEDGSKIIKAHTVVLIPSSRYSKGDYLTDVQATKNTYPDNGEKDGYWYVLKGEVGKDPIVKKAKSDSDDDIKGAIDNLPEGAKVDVVSRPERTAYTPEIKELTVKPGEKADLTQAVTNPKEGVKIVEKTGVDTSKVGKQTGSITVTLPAETKNAKAKITFKDQTTKEVDVPVEFKELSKDYDVTVNVKETAVKVTLNYVDESGKTVATKEMSVESGSKIKLTEIPELFGYKLLSTDDITVSEDGQAVTVKVKDLNAEIKSLEDQLNAKKGELSKLEEQLAAEKAKGEQDTAKIAELEKAINDKKAEIDKLNKQIGDLDEVIKQLQEKLNGLKGNLEAANKELAKSKNDLENLKKELEAKITDLNGQIADKDAKGKDLEKQLADEKAKGNQDATKIAELEKAIKDNNDAKDALNKEKEGLAKELADKEAKIAELEANAKKLEGNVKDLEAKIKDLIDGKSVDASALKKAEEALAQAKADNAKLADEVKKLQDSLKTEKAASAEKDKELSKLREEAKANHDSNLSELKKELKKELDRADKVDRKRLSEQENKKLDEAIKKAKDIFAKKDAKDDEVKQAIKDLKETLKPYENFIFDDKHINGLLGKNIKSLKDFIDKVEKAIGGTLIEEETISKDKEYTALKYVFMVNSNKYAQATNKDTKIYKMDVSPFIRNSRTMLPLRYVANVLGADVKWDNGTRTATFTKDGMEAKINIDEGKTIKVAGKSVELSAKPEIVQDRIFVPLTDISKVFEVTNGNTDDGINQDIEWNKDNRTVTVHIAR